MNERKVRNNCFTQYIHSSKERKKEMNVKKRNSLHSHNLLHILVVILLLSILYISISNDPSWVVYKRYFTVINLHYKEINQR